MKSTVIKRSIVIGAHKTSVSLEDAFWSALKEIAAARKETLSNLVATVEADRQHNNLSSAIRLFVLGFYRDQIPDRPEKVSPVALSQTEPTSELVQDQPARAQPAQH
jgi:predicted DNA-binding ribbon-helix-helix protein